jgi:hypothetical protein
MHLESIFAEPHRVADLHRHIDHVTVRRRPHDRHAAALTANVAAADWFRGGAGGTSGWWLQLQLARCEGRVALAGAEVKQRGLVHVSVCACRKSSSKTQAHSSASSLIEKR